MDKYHCTACDRTYRISTFGVGPADIKHCPVCTGPLKADADKTQAERDEEVRQAAKRGFYGDSSDKSKQ